jgi:transketolase
VLDPFTVKPIDSEAIIANAKECGGRILTVEDHYPEGMHKQLQAQVF